ncbi:MobF family relaxase [Rhodococcus aetherivorans]|uniref:MobF family relaxase n=1 Tax=Rhodococcus aetherivorans TaxID=191292 RepID=UPI00163AF2FF|nr:MobF family relaxase [Rhodococcus aetherivorans]MBC2586919.1 relaxase domain-containing protein [Rhodococcus aetherivorans]
MTLHVLHAADGYEYLTRQVATADRERERGAELTDYYTAHGTPPGEWFGSGLDGVNEILDDLHADNVERISAGDVVTEAQMKALFGEGLHPNADALIEELQHRGVPPQDAIRLARLGRKFPTFRNNIELFERHAAEIAEFTEAHGRAPSKGESAAILDRIAGGMFQDRHGRPVANQAELRNWIAHEKGKVRHPVAGHDLVFTPPKSVSSLWALAPNALRVEIERLVDATVKDTLRWLERNACFTRVGARSEEQIDTNGFVATLYTHFDSRCGDPNLHTHAVVSIKTQATEDGKWRAVDGSTLFRFAVAASQRFNAEVMQRLSTELGLELSTRRVEQGKQPVVELAAIPREMLELFSSRRTAIEARRDELVADYRAKYQRMPDAKTMYQLYQQATLDTRDGKADPKSLAEMRADWRAKAADILGGHEAVDRLVRDAVAAEHTPAPQYRSLDDDARDVIATLESKRSRWQLPHVLSAVQAHLGGETFPGIDAYRTAVDRLTERVLELSVTTPRAELPAVPRRLRRRNGDFVLSHHGSHKHSSQRLLDAETMLISATSAPTVFTARTATIHAVYETMRAETGRGLNAGQRTLTEHFLQSGSLLAVGVGPAGTGKTTSMKAVVQAWQAEGHAVLALAPSAVAADTLGDEVGVPGLTLASLTYPWRGVLGGRPGTVPAGIDITPGTMLLVDEASLASTLDLAAVVELAKERGAIVRLLGDPAQLDAVETGGLLRYLAEHTDAPELTSVVRFGDDSAQAENSLLLRSGDPTGLDLFYDRNLVREGTREEMIAAAVEHYLHDLAEDKDSLVLLPTREDVRAANLEVQAARRHDGIVDDTVTVALSDELRAGRGDIVLTRRNRRDLAPSGGKKAGAFVRNGDLWEVLDVLPERGVMTVRHLEHGGVLTLPADYLGAHVELGYACTVHRAQGVTVDTAHAVLTGDMDRSGLYVAVTRARTDNRIYVPVDVPVGQGTERPHLEDKNVSTGRMLLETIVATDRGHRTATEELAAQAAHATDPERLREAYLAAQRRLRDDALEAEMRRTLPEHLAATIDGTEGWAQLRQVLADAHDHGHSTRTVLGHALADGPLTRAKDIGAVLAHRVRSIIGQFTEHPALPPLPIRSPLGTDAELYDFAVDCARRYTDATDRAAAADTGIGAVIRRYRDTSALLETQRVRTLATAALGDELGARIAEQASARLLARQLHRAAQADIDPINLLTWHHERLTEQGADITAAALRSDMAKPLTELIARRNTAWLTEHQNTIAEHLPTLALQTDDERALTIAGRIQHLHRLTGAAVEEIAADLADRAGATAPVTVLLAELDRIAADGRDLTHPDAPDWIAAPVSDADTVDPDLAAQIRQDYQTLTDLHRDYRDQLTDDTAPTWAHTALGPCPDNPEHADRWRATVADAAAYRSTHHLTGDDPLVGARPQDRRAALDWTRIEQRRSHLLAHQERQQRTPPTPAPEPGPTLSEQRTRRL